MQASIQRKEAKDKLGFYNLNPKESTKKEKASSVAKKSVLPCSPHKGVQIWFQSQQEKYIRKVFKFQSCMKNFTNMKGSFYLFKNMLSFLNVP